MRALPGSSWPSPRRGKGVSVSLRGGALLTSGAFAFVFAYLAGWPELLIIACFCGIPPLLALLVVARSRPGFTVARFLSPPILMAGGTASVRMRVENRGTGTTPARWSDRIPWSTTRTPPRPLKALKAGGSCTLDYSFVPPRRGIFELGPLVIEFADPFGLARAEFEIGVSQRIVVAPEIVDLWRGAVDIASDSGSARLFQHRALAGEHDIMTRDWRPGDALRRVHWKASAHHGELMVREEEKRSHAEATILIDTRRASWRDASRGQSQDLPESESFEWALSMVASLRSHLTRSGLHVRVVETAITQLADADQGDEFVESLARIRLSYQDGPAPRLVQLRAASQGSIFAIVDAPDSETVGAMCEQRGAFDLAVVFLLGSEPEQLSIRLRESGWIVCEVNDELGVADAWLAIGVQDE